MKTVDLANVNAGLAPTWAGLLRDWDRSLRAGNYPATTRYNYLIAAAQLGRYLADQSPDPDAVTAAADPCTVTRSRIEAFQAWMIETCSASTALNKHKALQQFFKWLVAEEEMSRSPMDRVRQPKTPKKLIPVLADEDTRRLLDQCKGRSFTALRAEAIIRLLANTDARLSEVGNLLVTDVDLATDPCTSPARAPANGSVCSALCCRSRPPVGWMGAATRAPSAPIMPPPLIDWRCCSTSRSIRRSRT